MFDYVKDVAQRAKAKITKNKLQQLLLEATSDQNWQASSKVLNEIASSSYNQGQAKTWQKLEKGKQNYEFDRILNKECSFKQISFDISKFQHYTSYEEGQDKAGGVRQKTSIIINLLGNQQKLQQQRNKARQLRQRLGQQITNSAFSNYGTNSYSSNSSSYGNSYQQPFTGGISYPKYGGIGSSSQPYPSPSIQSSSFRKPYGLQKYKDQKKFQQDQINQAHKKLQKAKEQMRKKFNKQKQPIYIPKIQQPKEYNQYDEQQKPKKIDIPSPIQKPKPKQKQVNLLDQIIAQQPAVTKQANVLNISAPVSAPVPPITSPTTNISTSNPVLPTQPNIQPSTTTSPQLTSLFNQPVAAPSINQNNDLQALLGISSKTSSAQIKQAPKINQFTSFKAPNQPVSQSYVFGEQSTSHAVPTKAKSNFEESLFDLSDIKQTIKKQKTGMNSMGMAGCSNVQSDMQMGGNMWR